MNSTDPVFPKLAELGFNAPKIVEGRTSVAELFGKRRCGVYVLHFANGEHYVGKSVNVVRRYMEHRHFFRDIHALSFKPVARENAVSEEKTVTHDLEIHGTRLRNKENVTYSYGVKTPFDTLMGPVLQDRWLTDLDFNYDDGDRIANDVVRQKHLTEYGDLMNLPRVHEILAIAREYVQTSIPAYRIGENTFWVSTCLPLRDDLVDVYVRISVGKQMVFQAGVCDELPFFMWFITRSHAEEVFETSLHDIDQQPFIPLTEDTSDDLRFVIARSKLVKGSLDQVNISTQRIDVARDLLQDPYMLEAVRVFNLGLVQKGRCPWRNIHCYALADHLLE